MIKHRSEGTVLVCELEGRLDATQAEAIQDELLGIIAGNSQKVLIHLGAVAYLSSIGIRVLVRAAKQVRAAGGALKLCNTSPPVRKVLEISGMDGILDIRESEEAALAAF